MTTKTDCHAIMELQKKYVPAMHGIVNEEEKRLIQEILELNSRNDIELQNIRDMAMMQYARWIGSPQQADNISAILKAIDALSGICCIISQERFNRELDV